MIGLVMAGGKGTRMQSDKEKLLLEYKKPLVLHVVDALKNSNCFEKIIAVTSPNSPQTQKILIENDVKIIETLGDNFVTDPDLEDPAHVVDMEAYAIAKACMNQQVDFRCFKYVSDQANEGADTDWLKNIADGEEHYINVFQQITGGF